MLTLRPAETSDAPGIRALIAACYAEEGDVPDLDGYDADLADPAQIYREAGGAFVVLVEEDSTVAGTHGAHPDTGDPCTCILRRLYLRAELRGSGAGDRLMHWAVDRARENGFARIAFWSDVRFTRAHRFFARHGFVCTGEEKTTHDFDPPFTEKRFVREL